MRWLQSKYRPDAKWHTLCEWATWFAWRPVRSGRHWLWLETVERRDKRIAYQLRDAKRGGPSFPPDWPTSWNARSWEYR